MKPLDARPHILIAAMLFAIALAVYWLTLCPTVYWEDAGELITVSHVLGIAHPPGHPLYAILGHLFSLAPIGTIAARVNFMSAFFGALAAALVYPAVLTLRENDGKALIAQCSAVTAALFAAFGLTLWDQSVVAETSTLHAFFFMVLLLLFGDMVHAQDDVKFSRRLWLFSFLFGLSLTNHAAGVFVAPAFVLWALMKSGRRLFKWKNIAASMVFFSLGLSVYLYLPICSAQDPIIDWGNPENLAHFWWVVTAAQFRDNVFAKPAIGETVEMALQRLSDIRENYTGVGTVLIVLGVWDAFRRRKDFLLFAAVAIAVLFAVTLNPSFISAYFIPALLLFAVFLGLGGAMVVEKTMTKLKSVSAQRFVYIASCTLLLLLPVFPLARHYPMNDRSRNYHAREYGMTILNSLPPNAAFFTIDLNAVFTLWYLIYCEGMRPDVMVIEPTWLANASPMREELLTRYPNLLMPEVGERVISGKRLGENSMFDLDLLFEVLRKNAEMRPVYLGGVPAIPSLRPCGLVYEFVGTAENPLEEEAITRNAEFWEGLNERFQGSSGGLADDRVASLIYPETLRHQGQYFKTAGCTDLAHWAFELAGMMNPGYAPAWLHLGELCKAEGDFKAAFNHLEKAARLDYRVRARARYLKGQILYETGEYDLAMAEFMKVLRQRPQYPNVHNMIGSICLVQGDVRRAEREYREEIRRNPSVSAAYSNLAQIMIQKGNLDEAKSLLETGIDVDSGMWQNFYFLAMVEALKGNREAALGRLTTAFDLGGQWVRELSKGEELFREILPKAMEGVGQ